MKTKSHTALHLDLTGYGILRQGLELSDAEHKIEVFIKLNNKEKTMTFEELISALGI